MPLYEYQCDVQQRFETIQKFSDPPPRRLPGVRRRAGAQAAVVAGDSVQGNRLVHHRLREEVVGTDAGSTSGEKSRRRRRVRRRQVGRATRARRATRRHEVRQRRPSTSDHRADDQSDIESRADAVSYRRDQPVSRSIPLQVVAERLGQIRAPQREVHDRLQEPELVAGVVADAVDLAAVNRPRLEQVRAGRWSAGFRRSDRSRSPRARGRCRASGCSGR